MLNLLLVTLFGCPQAPELEPPDDPDTPVDTLPYVGGFQEGGWCDVQSIFQVGCVVGCHSGLVPEANLDLETNPYQAIVGVTGASGKILVDPGQPANSWLLTKMEGNDLTPADGDVMPPDSAYGELMAPLVETWIRDGAIDDCQGVTEPPTDYVPGDRYHAPGYNDPTIHGVENNLQQGGDCRTCHGGALDGGTSGVSCDSCHEAGWRTNCIFCHGGTDNETGAPPTDMDNEVVNISFPAHGEHVAGADHQAFQCLECHDDREDVLDPGHIFDDFTAGYGELRYDFGLSQFATYLFGTCQNVYCHGNGRAHNGTAAVGETYACYDCHPDVTASAEWITMSGQHERHLSQGDIYCADCHYQTVDQAQLIIGPQYHVDGEPQIDTNGGPVWNGVTCNGSCHNHNHADAGWPDQQQN